MRVSASAGGSGLGVGSGSAMTEAPPIPYALVEHAAVADVDHNVRVGSAHGRHKLLDVSINRRRISTRVQPKMIWRVAVDELHDLRVQVLHVAAPRCGVLGRCEGIVVRLAARSKGLPRVGCEVEVVVPRARAHIHPRTQPARAERWQKLADDVAAPRRGDGRVRAILRRVPAWGVGVTGCDRGGVARALLRARPPHQPLKPSQCSAVYVT